MKLPSVIIVSMVIVGVSNIWGFLDPTLEPHLRTFDLSPEKIGLIFLLFSALYGVFSPIWGWLADRANNHWSMMVWGLLLCTIGLLLLGPSPLLPFLNKTLWLNLLALSILGVSVALTLLPTFQSVLENAIDGGCRDEIGTYSMVAGIWSCMYPLGEVIGPSAGGLLVEHLGFPLSSTIMAGQTLIIALIALVFFSRKRRQQALQEISTDSGISESWEEESSPLLPEHNSSSNDRIQYYGRLSRDDSTESDTHYSVAVTAGGACEV